MLLANASAIFIDSIVPLFSFISIIALDALIKIIYNLMHKPSKKLEPYSLY